MEKFKLPCLKLQKIGTHFLKHMDLLETHYLILCSGPLKTHSRGKNVSTAQKHWTPKVQVVATSNITPSTITKLGKKLEFYHL